jgi:ElaB/YqjD/DUF883 family membrane-anchored ribosome-binding protein
MDIDDRAEGTIADAGEAVQRQVNRADEAVDEVATFVRTRPITALLIAVGVGYILGKIT